MANTAERRAALEIPATNPRTGDVRWAMRSTLAALLCATLATFLTGQRPAAESNGPVAVAVAELRRVFAEEVRDRAGAEARRARLNAWLEKHEGLELGDFAFLRPLAACHGAQGDERRPHRRALLAAVASRRSLPTGDFDAPVGHALLGHGLDLTERGQWPAAETVLRQVLRFDADHLSVLWLFGRRARDHEDDAGAQWLRETVVPAVLTDPTLADADRVHLLRRLLELEYHGPRPLGPLRGTDLDGRPVSRSDYAGRVLLVDFWATWCTPCMRAMPEVVAAHRAHRDEGFAVLGVCLDGPGAEQRIRRTARRLGMDWPQLYDGGRWQTVWAVRNDVRAIPATFLVDRSGEVRFTNLTGDALRRQIRELLRDGR